MIKYVLFDFGGVLSESGRKGFITNTLADLYEQNADDMDIGVYHAALRRGKTDDETVFRELNALYGKHVTKEMFLKKIHEGFEPAEVVYELAGSLRAHDIGTGILSNVFAMNAQVLREQGWYDGFDPVVLSCDVGYAKPDKEIYDIAIERCHVKANEILFIDDQDKCIGPAISLGMAVVQAFSPDQTAHDVREKVWQLNHIRI